MTYDLFSLPFKLLLAVSACERPVTPSSTFSMLPSVTSFIQASDNQASKKIQVHAVQKTTAASEESKEEKMETEGSTEVEKKQGFSKKEAKTSRCLFEIEDSEVGEQKRLDCLEKGYFGLKRCCFIYPYFIDTSDCYGQTDWYQSTNQGRNSSVTRWEAWEIYRQASGG